MGQKDNGYRGMLTGITNNKFTTPLVLFAIAAGLLFIAVKQRTAEKERKRREELKKDYPELISRLLLYLQAGLVPKASFIRISEGYRKERNNRRQRKRPAFEEVEKTCIEMDRGISEEEAYIRFGKRCVLPAYRTLSVLLVQSIKKGGTGLSDALEREIVAAMEERKRTSRAEGEKASVKLLLPMGLMLMVVLMITIIPALMSL